MRAAVEKTSSIPIKTSPGWTSLVLLHLSKAFDTVSHKTLVGKLIKYVSDKWRVRWTEICLIFSVQKIVISNTNCSWRPVTSAVSQVPILCPELFNILVNDLDDRMPKCIISKSSGTTKLRVMTDIPNGQVAIPSNLNRLEKWANRNLFKFNNRKYPVLPLKNNPMHQYRLRTNWIGSSFAEKPLSYRWAARCSWGTDMSLQERVLATFCATW